MMYCHKREWYCSSIGVFPVIICVLFRCVRVMFFFISGALAVGSSVVSSALFLAGCHFLCGLCFPWRRRCIPDGYVPG